MRWMFPWTSEDDERTAKLADIDRWWSAFAANEGRIRAAFRRDPPWDVPGFMQQHLGAVDERLMWEFSRGEGDGAALAITPESERALRPMLNVLLERAPKLEGWTFLDARAPEPVEMLASTLQGRLHRDARVGGVEVVRGEGNAVDLTWFITGCRGNDDQAARAVAFVATECLLGERMLDVWVGSISVARPKLFGRSGAPIEELRPRAERIIQDARRSLPPSLERGHPDATYSALSLKPKPLDEYASRYDLVTAVTSDVELFKAQHGNRTFFSDRFAPDGARFAYVKIEAPGPFDAERVRHRDRLSDAIESALRSTRSGAIVGVGTGLRYSYVDMVLTDVKTAAAVIAGALQGAGAARRSWPLDDREGRLHRPRTARVGDGQLASIGGAASREGPRRALCP